MINKKKKFYRRYRIVANQLNGEANIGKIFSKIFLNYNFFFLFQVHEIRCANILIRFGNCSRFKFISNKRIIEKAASLLCNHKSDKRSNDCALAAATHSWLI